MCCDKVTLRYIFGLGEGWHERECVLRVGITPNCIGFATVKQNYDGTFYACTYGENTSTRGMTSRTLYDNVVSSTGLLVWCQSFRWSQMEPTQDNSHCHPVNAG
jgi:hypothetical protein